MAKRPTAILINDTRSEFHHGCSTVYETITRLCERSAIDIIGTTPVHADWRNSPAAMDAFRKADIVIVNGEGTIHHDRPAGAWLLAAGPMARSAGKRSALVNTTWQANGADLAEMAKAFDIVSVRETASERELAAQGVTARRMPDLALYHQPLPVLRRSGIAYTDSVLGPVALELYRAMRPFGARQINLLFNRTSARNYLGLARRLVPGRDKYDPGRVVDALRLAALERRSQTPDRDEFARQVASSRVVVTGRFHMLVYCLATRTPLLAIGSNTHKNAATLADSGLETWRHVRIEDIDQALVDRASQWHGDEAERLETYVTSGRKAMETLFEDVRDLA